MRSRVAACHGRTVLKFIAAGLLASASAACSDSGRFSSNPFTNPFASAPTARVDKITTNSTPSRAAPVGPVTAQPLPSALPKAAAAATPRVASTTLQNASPIGSSAAGWTAAGGTPVMVGAGETANTLSARYGVPAAAITAANGGIIQPGRQAIIPVYAGQGGSAPKAGLMQPAPKPVAAVAPPAPVPVAAAPAPVPKVAAAPAPRPAAVQLPPQRPATTQPTLQQAAKPILPAKPAPSAADEDDDDDEEEPKKTGRIVAAAPKQIAPAVAAPAKPAAPAPKATEAPKPAPVKSVQQAEAPKPPKAARVIPMTPQEPPKVVAEAPKADPTTTASVPKAAPAAPAEDKPEFRWPAKGRVISGFGAKGGNGDGIAIAVPEGTQVKAAESGVVAYAGEELKGYGKLVLVKHDNGYVSAYAHNGELNVRRGEKVTRGQTIAKSGATGNVTSPQLHFELRKGSTPVDPTKYLEN
jgi:murein DD-endopeptidase MepM/ murein hydrolase activator NlpD